MSKINKLSIRGIRSFGTSKEDEQKIVFTSPLTLIVGENGCGKTTIIECLKYGLTGEVPPGSDRGKLFVHDPKVSGSGNSSHAQVKLEVTNIQKTKKQCIRTMSVNYVKEKQQFKTIDTTVRTLDEYGNPTDEGSNQIEMVNVEMANAMGVSKAILNNVIFCHQEDSAWPLDEGQKLKIKFDAIFGTTEYNKAIDKILKFRKEYQEKLKLCVQEKRFLEETKNDADRKQLDFDILKTKHEKMEAKIEELEQAIKPIEDRLSVLLTIEKNYAELIAEKAKIQSTIDNCKANEETTRKRIKEVLDEDIEEIESKLANFLASMATRQKDLNKLEVIQKKFDDDEKKLTESNIKDKSKADTIANHIGQMQELGEQRVKAIKALCEMLNLNLNIDLESQSLSVEDLGSSVQRIQQAIEDREEGLMVQKAEDNAKEDEIQGQIDKVREEKTAVETNIRTQGQRVKTLKEAKEKTTQEISKIERSMPNLPQLTNQIEAAEREVEKFKDENNVQDLEDDRDMNDMEKTELETKASEVEKDVEMLESISKLLNDIEQKQKELTKDQNEFDRTKNKQSTKLRQLLPGRNIEKNYKSTVQEFSDELETEVKQMKAELDKSRIDDSRLRTEREHLQKQSKLKETELRDAKERVEKVTDGGDFMDLLTSQKEKVDKINMELAVHKSSESMYKHYIAEVEQEPCCPVCHKNLEVNEKDDLKEEFKGKIRQLPRSISDTDKKLKMANERFYKLNECKSSYDSLEKLETEMKKFQEELKNIEEKFRENNQKIEDLEMQIAEPMSKQSLLDGAFLSDMVKLDDYIKGIAAKTQEVESLKAKLPEEMPVKTLVDAKNEFRQLNADIKAKNEIIKTLNQKINQTHSKLNQLQDKLNKIVSQKMEFQEKVQGLEQMRIQLKEKEKEMKDIEEKLEEDKKKLGPMTQKLADSTTDKEKLKREAAANQEKIQEGINKFKENQKDIDRQSKEIKTYEDMNLEQTLMETKRKISDEKQKLKKIQEEKEKNAAEIQRLSDEKRDQEGAKRNLEDNVELKKILNQLETSEKELYNLHKTIGEMEPKKLFQEKKDLRDKRDKFINEQSTIRGQITESQNRIDKEEKELSNPKYRNAKKNFLEGCIKEKVLNAIINDLHKYRAALERALLKFHADKMVQINQSIRHYWNNIYKGNDIDYILIKTDEEEKKSSSDKKRSYSYRVVQCKNGGSEIDMRGRCSAGQKVLASLIIRMALADTFAANCGILALDEPTTNLDQKNIQALCEALNDIIRERETIGNFMLVVITHDEDFVRVLQNVEEFHKVSRDPHGRSRIDKIQKK